MYISSLCNPSPPVRARLTLTDTVLEGTSYKTYAFYDANYNRLKGMQYPDGMTVGYYYNPMGYLQFEYNAASGYVFKEVTAQDAFGNVSADKNQWPVCAQCSHRTDVVESS